MKHNKIFSMLAGLSCLAIWFLSVPAAAQQTYSREDFASSEAPSLAFALDGLDAALVTLQSSGNPSGEGLPALRGLSSVAGNTPLVLIDGVESTLEQVVPADVDRITVLKDAAAAAIYGARAAAGAILITTRTGKGFDGPRADMKARASAGAAGKAFTDNVHLSARGGGDIFNYYLGAHYLGQASALDKRFGSGQYHNVGMVANFDARITKWLRYSLGVNYHFKDRSFPWWKGEGSYYEAGADLLPVYETVMAAGTGFNRNKEHGFVFRNALEATILREVTARVSYSVHNRYLIGQERVSPVDDIPEEIAPNRYRETRTDLVYSEADASLGWEHCFAGAHNLSLRAGYDWQDGSYKQIGVSVDDLVDPGISALSVGDNRFTITEPIRKTAQMGVYGRLSYDFKSRYSVEGIFREDGSSRYAPDHRWAPSFAGSLAWTVSEEPFFAGAKGVVSLLKLHYSYGNIASQLRDSAYPWLNTVSTGNALPWMFTRGENATYNTFDDETVAGFTWERVLTHDVGLDAAFLGGRLTLSGDFFIRDTRDMLVPAKFMPGIIGAGNALIGAGAMHTLGYEVTLGWKDRAGNGAHPVTYSIAAGYGDTMSQLTAGPAVTPTLLPLPRGTYFLRGRADWRGLDFAAVLQGVGRFDTDYAGSSLPGYFRVKHLSAGYTFDIRGLSFLRGIRVGVAAEDLMLMGSVPLLLPAEPLPARILGNLTFNF